MSEEIYAKGEWIVHANYGVGQVEGTDSKILEGEKKTFLKVKTFTSDYFLPISDWDVPHIRPLSSEYQIKKALSILRKPPQPMDQDHKQRSKQIALAVSDISLYSKAEIIRDLNGRKKLGKLNLTENEIFEKLIDRFINEWFIVSNKDREILREKVENALQISVEKLKKEQNGSWLEKVKKGVKRKVNQKSIS